VLRTELLVFPRRPKDIRSITIKMEKQCNWSHAMFMYRLATQVAFNQDLEDEDRECRPKHWP